MADDIDTRAATAERAQLRVAIAQLTSEELKVRTVSWRKPMVGCRECNALRAWWWQTESHVAGVERVRGSRSVNSFPKATTSEGP